MLCAVRCSRACWCVLALLCVAAAASADGGGAPRLHRRRGRSRRQQPRRTERSGSVVVVKRGDRGAAVRKVQAALGIAVDGVFGAQTEQAVKRFQKRKGLAVDGVVGPQTRDALGLDPFARGSVGARPAACGCRASCA